MDEGRRIRFPIPPLFLVASLSWGFACDPCTALDDIITRLNLQSLDTGDVLGLLAGGGVVVVTLGFHLSNLSSEPAWTQGAARCRRMYYDPRVLVGLVPVLQDAGFPVYGAHEQFMENG